MQNPEFDIDDRMPIWNCLQDLFMDTDVSLSYQNIATVCSQSKYNIDEISDILFQEVLPAVRFNLFALPAPEWCGFEIDGLVKQILKKHKFGKNKPLIGRLYTNQHWKILKLMIKQALK